MSKETELDRDIIARSIILENTCKELLEALEDISHDYERCFSADTVMQFILDRAQAAIANAKELSCSG